ncbi:MAG: ribonuclease HII [Oligoflexales bacterium]
MANAKTVSEQKGFLETLLLGKNLSVIGVDEVGRGCLAGPVFAAWFVMNFERLRKLPPKIRNLIRDSKQLSPEQRSQVFELLKDLGEYGVGSSTSQEIDAMGIVPATFMAMKRSLRSCKTPFDILLIDGTHPIPGFDSWQIPVVRGDGQCFSIAAASIVAKVQRDGFMQKMSKQFPGYDFESNVGYGTKSHMEGVKSQGPCPLHRMSFAPIRELCNGAQDMVKNSSAVSSRTLGGPF